MLSGTKIPSLTEVYSTSELIRLYCETLDSFYEKPTSPIQGLTFGKILGGKHKIPVFRTIKKDNILLVCICGTDFTYQ